MNTDNKRKGSSPKTVNSELHEFQLDIPRDCRGDFEPELVPKYCRNICGIQDEAISLYTRGMTTCDITYKLQDFYEIHVSAEKVSKITDRILLERLRACFQMVLL